MTPDGSQNIPNFALQGNPTAPEVLSNRVILTHPHPGNQRGAVWAERPLTHPQWTVDVDFRVNGPERGGGNLNIWLARDGAHEVGSSSVYTVGKFEGLVLVVDTHGGSGGMVRGFLSDGSKDYKTQPVDSLSFGHCDYSYRNLGRASQIKLRQTDRTFRVEVDGRSCFESDSISLPTGYHLGISAASADNPDSFEVFKVVVMTENLHGGDHGYQQQQQQQDQGHDQHQDQQQQHQQMQDPPKDKDKAGGAGAGQTPVRFTRAGMFQEQSAEYEKDLPDEDAGKITSSKEQFADLHNRLQSTNHHLSTIFRQVVQLGTVGEKRHEEISIQVGELKGLLTKLDRLGALEDKIDELEREMRSLHADLRQAVTNSEQSVMYHVTGNLAGHADNLADRLKPQGHGRLIFVIVAGQLVLVLGYVVYKRRRASSPKKYL